MGPSLGPEGKRLRADVAVIGGGPAGLAAAVAAKRGGVGRVVVIERDVRLGGILPQCIHTGFGVKWFGEELTGPEYAARFVGEADSAGVEFMLETMVLEVTPDLRVVAVSHRDGLIVLECGAIILAMGCRERPRGALAIPGTRPAGIFTAGTAQRLVNIEGVLPGRRAVILGSGDVGLIMARRLTLEGVKVEAVVEIMTYPGGLARNIQQCLRDFGIPLYLGHTVSRIHGRDRLEGVSVAPVDDARVPIASKEWFIPCDTLLLSVGLIPENELSAACGIELDPAIGGPVVTDEMETSVPGIFACGNVVHVHDLVDHVTEDGMVAGVAAAARAAAGVVTRAAGCGGTGAAGAGAGPVIAGARAATRADGAGVPGGTGEGVRLRACSTLGEIRPGRNVRYVVPQRFVRRGTLAGGDGRTLTISLRPSQPAEDVVLEVSAAGKVLRRQRKGKVRPGEMLQVNVDRLALPSGNDGVLMVSIVEREA
ncbi:MAG: NAD(P)/FAD-dependent oxidoreductase [Betaproteobacteria bacterium]